MKKILTTLCGVLFSLHIGLVVLGVQSALAASQEDDKFAGGFFVREAQKSQEAPSAKSVRVAVRHKSYRSNRSLTSDLPLHEEISSRSQNGAGLRDLIARHASENGVPTALAQAVVRVESNYNSRAVHAGNFGLMQIRFGTARSMGFSGSASALLNPDTNLHYGMKYLAQLYHMAGGDTCRSLMYYQSGPGVHHASGANRSYCRKAKSFMARA